MAMTPEWWQTFFSEPYLQLQADWFTDESTAQQVDKLEKMLGLQPGGRVLDVPCGEGRISRELADRGYSVVGVDITGPLLELAEKRALDRGVEVEWHRADMRDLQWEDEFDAVVNWWGSFGYFDDKGNLDFLKAAHRALKPGGRLVVDAHCLETLFPIFQARDWRRRGDMLIFEERTWDHENGRIVSEWTFLKGDGEQRRTISMSIYTYRQLVAMLRDAGFVAWEPHDWVTDEPFGFRSRRLGLVAVK